ncbi:hypothetical protein LZ31DRAFT_547897 [Colletotrichum somersetense]|nr:hypothetical protein LZ31DRAFT_547897 [Colletotrichum somersetense]
MSQSDRPSQQQCPVADCDWVSRTTGGGLQRHINNTHGKQMPCGDYVPEGNGNGKKGQDQVKEHLDNCPRCPRDSKDSSCDDTDRSSADTTESRPRARSNATSTQPAIKIRDMTVHITAIHSLIVFQTNIHTI